MKLVRLGGSLGFAALLLFSLNCSTPPEVYGPKSENPEFLRRSLKQLSDVIVYDIFSPPVASRVYAYPCIAAYETLAASSQSHRSFAGQLKGLEPLPAPEAGKEYSFPLASTHAFLTVGKALVFSEDSIVHFENQLAKEFKEIGVPSVVRERSIAYGEAVAAHILAWADKDNYKQTRTFPRYTVNNEADRWKPTPPAYIDAIEPHWNQLRPFVIDSATQFIPVPPTEFDMAEGSTFREELMEVYEVGNGLSEEQTEIAKFWDCNPFVMHTQGHVMYATKKITPGGHWMGIAMIAAKQSESSLIETAEAYALTSIALADAFISCWDEKYRSNLIRPETVINEHIDENWLPLLQTPPFPEYTSGHSVISTAAATALSSLYGESFSFLDTTEMEFGLPARSFNSFKDAAAEAAVSRLYGGIHYMPAIDNGVSQGKRVGDFVMAHIETRKTQAAAQ